MGEGKIRAAGVCLVSDAGGEAWQNQVLSQRLIFYVMLIC